MDGAPLFFLRRNRMNRLYVAALLATVAILGLTAQSQAGGLFRRCGGCEAAPCAPCAPVEVKYEERKVIQYKTKFVEKEIEVLECKRFLREEKYTYTVCVAVTTPTPRKEIVCTPKYTEVDCTYTVMVPKTELKEVMCTTYTCERVMVTEKVPVCKTVCVTCVDECGRCFTRRERVTVIEEVTRCVVKRTPVVTKQMVSVTTCYPELRKGKKTVCEMVRSERDVIVNVCSYVPQKREGVRTVCEYKTEKVMRKVQVCETYPVEVTVRVPVCSTSCSSPCNDCGHTRGGLFRRGSCCN
jgi:hypothetical protein